MIEDSTPEGRWLLELIRNHKSVTVVNDGNPDFKQAAKECNAVPVCVFVEKLRAQISEEFKGNA